MVFAGVGFVSLPMDLIREFVGRPRSTIPRSEYINRAMALGQRAAQLKVGQSSWHALYTWQHCIAEVWHAHHL